MERTVDAAARAMDIEYPGWAGKIDTKTLDLFDCSRCILGQIFGSEKGYMWAAKSTAISMKYDLWNALFASSFFAPEWQRAIAVRLAEVVVDPLDTEWSELQRSTPAEAYVYA